VPDVLLDAVTAAEFDMIVLRGGSAGTEPLKKDERVKKNTSKDVCPR